MTRKTAMIGLIGSGILLAGLTVGLLFSDAMSARAAGGDDVGVVGIASTPTPSGTGTPTSYQKYCMLYVQTLASNLSVSTRTHVTVQQVQAANLGAARTTIQRAYADGQITQAQETRLLARANQIGTNPCAGLHSWGMGGHS